MNTNKKLLALATAALLSLSSLPASATAAHDMTVKVNGLVCDFCARSVEKVFGAKEEVGAVKVNLDTHEVTLDFKDGRDLSDEAVTKLITDSGYNVVEIKRSK